MEQPATECFDFVIVGGGTVGAVSLMAIGLRVAVE